MGNSHGKPVVLTDEVNLSHFRLLRVVGKGAFGKVRIVERKDSGLTFALKYIRKDEVVRSGSVRNIIRERRMLERLNHPFLCNLRYSFQDIEYLYIVVDLMNGGDLRFHISRKTFTEEALRFWMAELGCALRYIHSQGIVHRDVKPDNVLLDSEGHVHLADFNVASDFRPSKALHSKSGTLAYLAPEMFDGSGYLSEVDWWALGVTFYECLYHKRPFDAKGQAALTETIKAANPKFHVTQPPVSMACLHAVSSLLERDRSKRIGAAGFHTFTSNPFFQPLDFEALERKQVPPIFVPSQEKTNFDATYDLEELLLEEAPLEARARRQRPRAELREAATEKEIREEELHRMIETLFEPFDYTTPNDDGKTDVTTATGEQNEASPDLPTTTSSHRSRGRSSPTSRGGSPPLNPSDGPTGSQHARSERAEGSCTHEHRLAGMAVSESARQPWSPSSNRPSHAQAAGGPGSPRGPGNVGSPILPDESAGRAGPAAQAATLPADSLEGVGAKEAKGVGGVLGFLGRKKGRDRSPKPQEPGILGKEGARRIIH